MNGPVNGFSINGAAYPNWVIRAVVVAVAAASVNVAQTRICFGSAFGDGVVDVHLTQTHTIQARATATAGATVDVHPTVNIACSSVATASATGNGAVRRDVFASAGGDATCYAEALTAQAIGEASASMAATVVLADAHIIYPGRANTPCNATGSGAGDVTRYPTVLAGYGEITYTRGEASVKRNGTSFYELDGYAFDANATATGEVPQDRIKIIATLGSFDYCDSTATVRSFIRHPGRALGTGVLTAYTVTATHIYKPHVNAQASATGEITGTRTVLPATTATAGATAYAPKGLINHASTGTGIAAATVAATPKRTAFGELSTTATATLASAIQFGVQHRTTVDASASASVTASALQNFAGHVNATASAAVGLAQGTRTAFGQVNDIVASATVGRAYALANSDIKAPDDRYMLVGSEDRVMPLPAEDRTMVVTA